MPKLDNVNQLVATIQRQIAAKSDKTAESKPVAKGGGVNRGLQREEVITDVSEVLRRRFKKFPLDTVEQRKRARLVLIEAILEFELGGQLALDPKFSELAVKIEQSISLNEAVSKSCDQIVESYT